MLFDRSEIEQAVDRLLHLHGEYRPTDLLVALGRLDPADVQAWQTGSEQRLSDLLFGDVVIVARELLSARNYAERLGLLPEREAAIPPEGTPPGLTEGWATTRWTRPAAPQLDLFFDGRATSRARELITALAGHDRSRAAAALDELERTEPGHPLVGAAPQLLAAMAPDLSDPDAAWPVLESASRVAEGNLEQQAADYLRPLWTAMADALACHPDARHHPSAAWARIGDWEAVVRSLGDDPTAVSGPEQLMRAVQAHERTGDHRAALHWFFHLCWRYPETGEDIERLADRTLNLDAALDRWDDRELVREWGWQEFPSWLILIGHVPADRWANDPAATGAFRALVAVLRDPSSIEARQALQQAHGGVFRQFIAFCR